VFGAAAGLGLWSSPAVLYFAAPAGIWVVARRGPPLRWLAVAVPTAVAGALPWIWHNVEQDWAGLDRPPQPEHVSFVTGLGRLLWRTLPMALNLRYPISDRWLVSVVAPLLYLGLGALLVFLAVRRRDRPVLLLAVLAAFPLIYASLPGAWFIGDGRYALFVAPFLALAVAWMVGRVDVLVGIAVISAVLSFVVMRPVGSEYPRHLGADIAALRRVGVDHVWADYWLAYRLTFESDGAVSASSYRSSRDMQLFRAALRDTTPAFMFPRASDGAETLVRALSQPHRVRHTRHFTVVLLDRPIDPGSLPESVRP
jgi:hypothetical protein